MPSYQKRESGLWSVRFAYGSGQKRLSGYKTKKEAQWAYEDFIATNVSEVKKEEPIKERYSFVYIMSKFLEWHKTRVKATTYYDNMKKLEKHIEPFFQGYTMDAITPNLINEWMQGLKGSYNQKKSIFSLLSSVIKYGERYYNTSNMLSKVDKFRRIERKTEIRAIDVDTFNALIENCVEPYKMLFTFLFYTGCRKGEAIALEWSDIDFARKTAHINKNYSKLREITSTKNEYSDRFVLLSSNLVRSLSQYKNENKSNSNLVFNVDGKYLAFTTIQRHLDNVCQAAGIEPIRVHDLRHSFACMMLKKLPVHIVSKMLGHANVTQTLDTYSHYINSDDAIVLQALNSL